MAEVAENRRKMLLFPWGWQQTWFTVAEFELNKISVNLITTLRISAKLLANFGTDVELKKLCAAPKHKAH